MKKFLFIPIILFAAFICWYFLRAPAGPRIKIGRHVFRVELADTSEKRAQGLAGRNSMPAGRGMLFIFEQKKKYVFWMKGMRFPLDFIWLDGDRVVDITQNVPIPKGGKIPACTSRAQTDKVLEINAGTVEKIGVRTGDTVTLLY